MLTDQSNGVRECRVRACGRAGDPPELDQEAEIELPIRRGRQAIRVGGRQAPGDGRVDHLDRGAFRRPTGSGRRVRRRLGIAALGGGQEAL